MNDKKTMADYTDDELRKIRDRSRAKIRNRDSRIAKLQSERRTAELWWQLAHTELDKRKHRLKASRT